MKLRLLAFAVYREQLGAPALEVELPATATVADLRAWIAARYPAAQRLLPVTRVAVNGAFVGDAHRLAAGDEAALIPPVAGGGDGLQVSGFGPSRRTSGPET